MDDYGPLDSNSEARDCEWFVYADDRHEGPLSTAEVRERIDFETLRSSDPIWKEGMQDWLPIEEAFLKPNAPDASKPGKTFEPRFSVRPYYRAISPTPRPAGVVKTRPTAQRGLIALRALFIGSISVSTFFCLTSPLDFTPGLFKSALNLKAPLSTAFVVKTDLPEGTPMQVMVEGQPETLVGIHEFKARQTVIVKRGRAETQPFVVPGQQSLPPGEYRVKVEGANGDGTGELAVGDFFLGGARDDEYAQQLKAYHEVIREQASSELTELKQYATTLEDQLSRTDQTFQALWEQGGRNPVASMSAWKSFSQEWQALQDQLNPALAVSGESPRVPGVFYAKLYDLANSARERVDEVHREQGTYFAKGAGDEELEGKIAESASIAESTVLSLKLKIALAAKSAD
jgi:hypothetical protein